jgi:hypothetical protein
VWEHFPGISLCGAGGISEVLHFAALQQFRTDGSAINSSLTIFAPGGLERLQSFVSTIGMRLYRLLLSAALTRKIRIVFARYFTVGSGPRPRQMHRSGVHKKSAIIFNCIFQSSKSA